MAIKIKRTRVAAGGPGADDPWTAVVATEGTGPTQRRAEAGVQAMGRGLWGVWGWNAESRQSYLNSTAKTRAEAMADAEALVLEKVNRQR